MALKIVYKICCGIDVRKSFVVACIASTDSKGVTIYERIDFNLNEGLVTFITLAARTQLQGCL